MPLVVKRKCPANPESQNVEELKIDYDVITGSCFFPLGKFNWQPVAGGCADTSDFVAAVSLYDCSIWAIYNSGEDIQECWETDEESNEAQDEPQPSFRPSKSKLWGRLPGLENSTHAVARIAENVQTCCFESNKEIEWWICKGNWSSVDVPLFLPARKDSDGNAKPLFDTVQHRDKNLATTPQSNLFSVDLNRLVARYFPELDSAVSELARWWVCLRRPEYKCMALTIGANTVLSHILGGGRAPTCPEWRGSLNRTYTVTCLIACQVKSTWF